LSDSRPGVCPMAGGDGAVVCTGFTVRSDSWTAFPYNETFLIKLFLRASKADRIG
jgi:hypothetical protein